MPAPPAPVATAPCTVFIKDSAQPLQSGVCEYLAADLGGFRPPSRVHVLPAVYAKGKTPEPMCCQPCTPRERPLNPRVGAAVDHGAERTATPSVSRRRWRALGRLVVAARRCGRPRADAQWQRCRGLRSLCPTGATAPHPANQSSLPCLSFQGGARRCGLGAGGHRAGLHRPPTDTYVQRATKETDAVRLPVATGKTCGRRQGRRSPTFAGRHAVGVPTTGGGALTRAATGGSLLPRRARWHRRPHTAGRRSGRVQPQTQPCLSGDAAAAAAMATTRAAVVVAAEAAAAAPATHTRHC